MQPDRRFIWRAEAGARNGSAPGQPASPPRTVRHSCRVLVVDDDVLIRAQLCALLHGSDYEVETAASGEEALRLLRAYPCDIVITDWQMPIMDGVALCRQVRSMEQHERIYLLMLTVRRSPEELLTGFAAGADDYVVKGTSNQELLARLEKGRGLAHWRATHAKKNDDVGIRSLMDAASGAYNIAYLIQHLPREMARSERYGRCMAVVNCEIGNPGQGNERLPDDELARKLIAASTECMRKSDWLVRSGRNALMIVLPETNEKGARCLAGKLTERFHDGTIKFTVTALDPDLEGGGLAPMRALLRHARGVQHTEQRTEKRASIAGGANYLSDFELAGEPDQGRNWPAS